MRHGFLRLWLIRYFSPGYQDISSCIIAWMKHSAYLGLSSVYSSVKVAISNFLLLGNHQKWIINSYDGFKNSSHSLRGSLLLIIYEENWFSFLILFVVKGELFSWRRLLVTDCGFCRITGCRFLLVITNNVINYVPVKWAHAHTSVFWCMFKFTINWSKQHRLSAPLWKYCRLR